MRDAERSQMVTVGEERVKEFIQAELRYFGHQQPSPINLHQIVAASTPELVADMVLSNLPLLYSAQIKHIESLDGWEEEQHLVQLYNIFHESFTRLRLMERTCSNMEEVSELILNIRRRHTPFPSLVSSVLSHLYYDKSGEELGKLDQWAEEFLKARIPTEMLTAHFSAFLKHGAPCSVLGGEYDDASRRIGAVDMYCDPVEICRHAAKDACRPFIGAGVEDITIEVVAPPCKIEFSYIPKYLKYIVEELLVNSIRATLDAAEGRCDASKRPIQVLIAADSDQVAICIKDMGGGLPTGPVERVWSYGFSTTAESIIPTNSSPLMGRGLGLPLSRLYAGYLGGSLEVMNVTGVGVDAYLFLERINPFEK